MTDKLGLVNGTNTLGLANGIDELGVLDVSQVGEVLTGKVGLWVNFPTGYAYQLLRNGAVFQAGPWGPGPTYTVQVSDIGSVLSLNVIASNSSGAGPVASSHGVVIGS